MSSLVLELQSISIQCKTIHLITVSGKESIRNQKISIRDQKITITIQLILNSQSKMVTYTCYNQELVREPLSLWSELPSIWLRKVDGLRKKLYLRSNQTSLTNSYSQDSTKLLLRLLRKLLKVYQLHQVPLLVKSFSSQNVLNNLRLNKR